MVVPPTNMVAPHTNMVALPLVSLMYVWCTALLYGCVTLAKYGCATQNPMWDLIMVALLPIWLHPQTMVMPH